MTFCVLSHGLHFFLYLICDYPVYQGHVHQNSHSNNDNTTQGWNILSLTLLSLLPASSKQPISHGGLLWWLASVLTMIWACSTLLLHITIYGHWWCGWMKQLSSEHHPSFWLPTSSPVAGSYNTTYLITCIRMVHIPGLTPGGYGTTLSSHQITPLAPIIQSDVHPSYSGADGSPFTQHYLKDQTSYTCRQNLGSSLEGYHQLVNIILAKPCPQINNNNMLYSALAF